MRLFTKDYWEDAIQFIPMPAQAFIDGSFVDARAGQTFEVTSPRDGSKLADVAEGTSLDVDCAIQSARNAFEDGRWRRQSPRARKRVLLRLAEIVEDNRESLALLDSLDMGKPVMEAYNVDTISAITCIDFYAEAIDKSYDEVAPTPSNVLGTITREPIGVVGAVIPWNFPLLLAAWKLAPALATGNSVVIKPAEQSPLSALLLARLAAEAGVPDGVLNVVPGFGHTAGAAIGKHMDVDAVSFTGSTEVGRKFLTYSGESNMKSVSLECGGKSPQIVFADAPDLERAAKDVALGIFYNQGEVCNAGSRLLVQDEIADEFLDRVLHYSKDFLPGDPLDPETKMGAIVTGEQLERVLTHIRQGQSEGASLVSGGSQAREATGGYYIEPTVFTDVTPQMTINQEEIFGPVLATTTFSTESEALKLANSSVYGLAAAVWSSDVGRVHRLSRDLRAGTVFVNCWDTADMTVPFGGYKQSGLGRDKSLHAMEKYTQLKSTWLEF